MVSLVSYIRKKQLKTILYVIFSDISRIKNLSVHGNIDTLGHNLHGCYSTSDVKDRIRETKFGRLHSPGQNNDLTGYSLKRLSGIDHGIGSVGNHYTILGG